MLFYKAPKIFNGFNFLEENQVMVLNDDATFIEFIDENTIDKQKVRFFDGLILPGFINVHGHIELSHMHLVIPKKTGFTEFAKNIITKRADNIDSIKEKTAKADSLYLENGIVAAGDICNTTNSIEIKQSSKIHYHSFIEIFSFNPNQALSTFSKGEILLKLFQDKGLSASITPHAPYSVSSKLFEIIKQNQLSSFPFTIHNQESNNENLFFKGIASTFDNFYKEIGLDITWFKPNYKSSLDYYYKFLPNNSILVHNTFTSEKDIDMAGGNVFWCFCPNANLYIENQLPDFNLFAEFENQICFGTDSLASNDKLDLVSEANHFYLQTKKLETTLRGLTSNAAKALKLGGQFGSFIKGKNTGLNLIKLNENGLQFVKKVH
ncbi:MAG: amidohydrolase family protein [Bacteroidia bacterium]